jgi:hypothetical protein
MLKSPVLMGQSLFVMVKPPSFHVKKNTIFQLRWAFLMIEPPFFVAELQLRGSNSKAGDLRGALVWLREASELGAEGGEATFLALLMGCDAWSMGWGGGSH